MSYLISKVLMKLKIKYRVTDPVACPIISKKGDWIDLAAVQDVKFKAPHNAYNTRKTTYDVKKVSLGIAMALPKGFEAIIAPRSSLYKAKSLTLVNSIGIIDYSYRGDNDIWSAYLKANADTSLNKGERILQFRIQPSQKASIWAKLKWIFTSSISFEKVESLTSPDRGGFGSSGGYKSMKS